MVIEMKPRGSEKPDARRHVQTIRTRLAEATGLLERSGSESVEASASLLEAALNDMRHLEAAVAQQSDPAGEMRSAMHAIRRDLARVQALLQQAAEFHHVWAQMLGAAAGGYTPQGHASGLEVAPRFSIDG